MPLQWPLTVKVPMAIFHALTAVTVEVSRDFDKLRSLL